MHFTTCVGRLPAGKATVTVARSPGVRPVSLKLKKPFGKLKPEGAPAGVVWLCKSVSVPFDATKVTMRPDESAVMPVLTC